MHVTAPHNEGTFSSQACLLLSTGRLFLPLATYFSLHLLLLLAWQHTEKSVHPHQLQLSSWTLFFLRLHKFLISTLLSFLFCQLTSSSTNLLTLSCLRKTQFHTKVAEPKAEYPWHSIDHLLKGGPPVGHLGSTSNKQTITGRAGSRPCNKKAASWPRSTSFTATASRRHKCDSGCSLWTDGWDLVWLRLPTKDHYWAEWGSNRWTNKYKSEEKDLMAFFFSEQLHRRNGMSKPFFLFFRIMHANFLWLFQGMLEGWGNEQRPFFSFPVALDIWPVGKTTVRIGLSAERKCKFYCPKHL